MALKKKKKGEEEKNSERRKKKKSSNLLSASLAGTIGCRCKDLILVVKKERTKTA